MPQYLMAVETRFWVTANSEEEAQDLALEQMPLSDLDFVIEQEKEDEEA